MKTHIPGPWKFIQNKNRTIDFFGEDGRTVFITGAIVMNEEANAPLIAAAPELLTALKDLEAQMLLWTDSDLNGLMPRVRAAIVKAEGGAA